jgi:hypothetical protein
LVNTQQAVHSAELARGRYLWLKIGDKVGNGQYAYTETYTWVHERQCEHKHL